MKILVAEDDISISSLISRVLSKYSHAVDKAKNGREAYDMLHVDSYDLLVLDLMMPLLNGENLLRQLRSEGVKIPVIVLTAKESVSTKIDVLNSGADDYVTKPFDIEELAARVSALGRRGKVEEQVLKVDNLTLEPTSYFVERAGIKINLSAKEFSVLMYLMENKGKIVKETQIINRVWDREYDGLSNIVAVYIRYLREKIDKPFPQYKQLIKTMRGFGYMIDD